MKPELFFDPVPEEFIADHISSESVGESLSSYFGDNIPDWKGADLAIFSVNEFRGIKDYVVDKDPGTQFRNEFYQLTQSGAPLNIADLGQLRLGPSRNETSLRIKEVCAALIEQNVVPIIIGGSHDLFEGQFLAFDGIRDYVRPGAIDALIDMAEESETTNRSHLRKVLLHEPNIILGYYHIAHQSFLVQKSALESLEKLNFEVYRLGILRDQFEEIEPVIRSLDLLSFDLGAIRKSDFPANTNPQPFGLTAEEACRLCWYAGLNHSMSSIGFYDYNPDLDEEGSSAKILATMVWYFVEGFYNRKGSLSFKSSEYTKYVVDMSTEPGELIFYKHKSTEKWWMEVQFFDRTSKKILTEVTPCSYSDFQNANSGEIPNRWLLANARLA